MTKRGGVDEAITAAVRSQWTRVMATLVADLGDVGAAEDAAQEAVLAALDSWPNSGVPDSPGAWIVTVARRKAIDKIRRDENRRAKTERLGQLEARVAQPFTPEFDDALVRDEQLQLIFGCCHPALRVEAQVALTLKAICGLATDDIAAAFLVPVPTMAQRLVRAKRKIASTVLPFRIPEGAELLARVSVVHEVIYLLFNEGYARKSGPDLVAVDLCDEAIRLVALLADLLVDDAESHGLLALLLLTHARRAARTGASGELILLPDQDRSRWDRAMIERGSQVLDRALRLEGVGRFQLHAAIAALHAEATEAVDTDWAQVEALYGRWMRLAPTPVIELNRLVAVSMVAGPGPALERLDQSQLPGTLAAYVPYWALRGDLLARLGRNAEAIEAFATAADLTDSAPETAFFELRVGELS